MALMLQLFFFLGISAFNIVLVSQVFSNGTAAGDYENTAATNVTAATSFVVTFIELRVKK